MHHRVTIVGQAFGTSRGTVYFLLGADLFEAAVSSWTNTRIVATVPHELMPWNRAGDVPSNLPRQGESKIVKDSEVWVRLADERWGGGLPLQVGADIDVLRPTITGITPTVATPGGDLLIDGSNFGNRHVSRGGSTLAFASGTIPIEVREWSDNEIVVRVKEDISGQLAMSNGRLSVTNRFDLEDGRAGVSFTPAMEVVELPSEGEIVVHCHPWALPPFCWFGEERRAVFFDHELKNGWTVDDSWLDVYYTGANANGYYTRQPRRGDSSSKSKVNAFADGLSAVTVIPHVSVVGPRGTQPL